MRIPVNLRSALPVLLLITELAAARTWVVDSRGGAGHDFTTIQAAVTAATGGDTILVRSGTYFEHVRIDGKALELVGLQSPILFGRAATPGPCLEIVNLPAGGACAVRGFAITRILGTPGEGLRLANNQGRIWLEAMFVDNYDGVAVRIAQCAELVLSDVFAQANRGVRDAAGRVTPSVGMSIEASGRVSGFKVSALGSHAGPPDAPAPTAGGAGLTIDDSSVDLVGGQLSGGHGGSLLVGACRVGAIGGSALRVTGRRAVTLRGLELRAGSSGAFDAGCAADPGTAAEIADPAQLVATRAGLPRQLFLPVTPNANSQFEAQLRGAPNDAFAVFLGLDASAATPLPGLDGNLFLAPPNFVLAHSGVLSAQGAGLWRASLRVTGGPLHVRAQAVLLDGSANLWLSGPSSMTLP